MMKRKLGPFDIAPIGMGCWAIGGEVWDADGSPAGMNKPVDDKESIAAIHAALDMGLSFIDTANMYGGGHSERVIGQALKGKREQAVVATKFGVIFDEEKRQVIGIDPTPAGIMKQCEDSLRRLSVDYIDLYQCHLNDYPVDEAESILDTLEDLVKQGKIKTFGWSTDFPDRAQVFVNSPNCIAFQYQYNLFEQNPDMLAFVEQHQVTGITRTPLAMGLVSGKYTHPEQFSENDIRRQNPEWLKIFEKGEPNPVMMKKLDAIKEILGSHGRSKIQGALAWILAMSPQHVAIPGFRNKEQLIHNAETLQLPPMTQQEVDEIQQLVLGK